MNAPQTPMPKVEAAAPSAADTRKHAIRTAAIDMAIKSNCGQCYDENERIVFNAGEIVKAAKTFEDYISGKEAKPEVKPEPKKEGW